MSKPCASDCNAQDSFKFNLEETGSVIGAFPLSTFHTEVMKVEPVGHFWTIGDVQRGLHLFTHGAPGLSMSPCAKGNAKQEHITSCVDKYKKRPPGKPGM